MKKEDFEERFFEKKEHRFHNCFWHPGKNYVTQKKWYFRKKLRDAIFVFWCFLRVRRVRRGVQVRRGAQGGADEACLRARGGPMLRGFVDALER